MQESDFDKTLQFPFRKGYVKEIWEAGLAVDTNQVSTKLTGTDDVIILWQQFLLNFKYNLFISWRNFCVDAYEKIFSFCMTVF